jgi:hypothetical protein
MGETVPAGEVAGDSVATRKTPACGRGLRGLHNGDQTGCPSNGAIGEGRARIALGGVVVGAGGPASGGVAESIL